MGRVWPRHRHRGRPLNYTVAVEFSATARRLGIFSGAGVLVLGVAYAITLAIGLLSLTSAQLPVGDPMFSILEVLIIIMMPMMVALMVAVHAWAPSHAKTLSLTAVLFMGLLAGVTCSLHFVILTLRRQTAFAGQSWLPLFLSFKWPSVAYALDILAWDFFFALSMLFAAPVFEGSRLGRRPNNAFERTNLRAPRFAHDLWWLRGNGGDRVWPSQWHIAETVSGPCEWLGLHRAELLRAWALARDSRPLPRIER